MTRGTTDRQREADTLLTDIYRRKSTPPEIAALILAYFERYRAADQRQAAQQAEDDARRLAQ